MMGVAAIVLFAWWAKSMVVIAYEATRGRARRLHEPRAVRLLPVAAERPFCKWCDDASFSKSVPPGYLCRCDLVIKPAIDPPPPVPSAPKACSPVVPPPPALPIPGGGVSRLG